MLIIEMTLYQLDRSTRNTFGDGRDFRSNEIQVRDISYSRTSAPNGNQQLMVQSEAIGSTGKRYNPTILYNKVQFEEQDTPQNITVQDESGRPLHINAQSAKSSDVKVCCDCLDFYWRFATWNLKHKSLLGNPPKPYVKTTDRPPVNPEQKAGVCKHLYKLVKQLQAQRIM